jgi:hypothetical protein
MSKFSGVLIASALAAAAALATPPAEATNVVWNFGVGTGGDIGLTTTQLSVPDSIPIIVSAFGITGTQPPTPPDLFRKEVGGDETGMGLTNDPTGDDEISAGHGFIQLDLASLNAIPPTSFALSFMADSTTSPDEWQVCITNTAGSDTCATPITGTDELIHTINTGGDRYLDVSAVTGNVLLSELNANVVPAPLVGHGLPALLAIGGILFGAKLLERGKRHRLQLG